MIVRDVQRLEKIAFILKTIAHPLRLQIVELLDVYGDLSVSAICEKLKTEQSLTSHHLSNMKLKGILRSKKEGRKVLYSLKEKSVLQILNCLDDCNCNMG